MADALVERGGRTGPVRFFCHRCNVEFEDTLQEYICPYCSGGFIEELGAEPGAGGGGIGSADGMDTDSSDNLAMSSDNEDMVSRDGSSSSADGMDTDDSDNEAMSSDSDDMEDGHPVVNDLAFLMSGGRLRGMLGGAETLLQQFVWALAGGNDARGAGAPFVLVGAPGDYVFGGEGLDAVVTQLLGQLEGSGPPPLPRDQIDLIQTVAITEEQAAARLQCSVCWELFNREEMVSKLSCSHVFHPACIQPWLRLHATCPICRRCLLPEQDGSESEDSSVSSAPSDTPPVFVSGLGGRTTHFRAGRGRSRRADLRRPWPVSTPTTSSSSATSVGGVWGPPTPSASSNDTPAPHSDSSRQSSEYNMDLDFD